MALIHGVFTIFLPSNHSLAFSNGIKIFDIFYHKQLLLNNSRVNLRYASHTTPYCMPSLYGIKFFDF